MNSPREGVVARLVEVPPGYENGGDFFAQFDGVSLNVAFGDDDDSPCISFEFKWVRSFRYISEATYDNEREHIDVMDALLSELSLPDANNPSNDYYGDRLDTGKGPPRLFRLFHYKAGLIDAVASDWRIK